MQRSFYETKTRESAISLYIQIHTFKHTIKILTSLMLTYEMFENRKSGHASCVYGNSNNTPIDCKLNENLSRDEQNIFKIKTMETISFPLFFSSLRHCCN